MPEEIKGKFECSGENTEKYITFSVPIKKEIVINDDDEKDDDIKEEEEEEEEEEEGNDCDSKEEEVVNIKKEEDNNSKKKKTITYKMQFIDSYRLMPNKLSDLVDNLSGFCSKECKSCMEKKIRLKCKFIGFNNNRLRYKFKECRNECAKSTNEAVKNFPTLYRFCNCDLDNFF